MRSILQKKALRFVFAANVISMIGNGMNAAAVAWYVLQDAGVLSLLPCQASGRVGRVDAGEAPSGCAASPGRLHHSEDAAVALMAAEENGEYFAVFAIIDIAARPEG